MKFVVSFSLANALIFGGIISVLAPWSSPRTFWVGVVALFLGFFLDGFSEYRKDVEKQKEVK